MLPLQRLQISSLLRIPSAMTELLTLSIILGYDEETFGERMISLAAMCHYASGFVKRNYCLQ
jgi:hypothetical protein